MAAWLAGRVHPGDRVLLATSTSTGFVRCYLGALRAGAAVVLANPAYTAADSGIWWPTPARCWPSPTLSPRGGWPGWGLGGSRPLVVANVRELPQRTRPTAGIMPGPDDEALLAYTSGTTGKPKGVPLTTARWRSRSARRWRPGDGTPMTCSYTRCRCTTSTAWAGCTPR